MEKGLLYNAQNSAQLPEIRRYFLNILRSQANEVET